MKHHDAPLREPFSQKPNLPLFKDVLHWAKENQVKLNVEFKASGDFDYLVYEVLRELRVEDYFFNVMNFIESVNTFFFLGTARIFLASSTSSVITLSTPISFIFIQPIVGISLFLQENEVYFYAKNYQGYQNLLKLESFSHQKELELNDLEAFKDEVMVILPYTIGIFKSTCLAKSTVVCSSSFNTSSNRYA